MEDADETRKDEDRAFILRYDKFVQCACALLSVGVWQGVWRYDVRETERIC